MPSNYDDHSENKSAHRHRVTHPEEPAKQSDLTQEDSAQAKRLAAELFEKLVDDVEGDTEKARKLWKEPDHPLVAPCQRWLAAIEQRDIVGASIACSDVVTLMQTYYLQRPNYKAVFDHFRLAEPLSPANVQWVEKLVALASGKSL